MKYIYKQNVFPDGLNLSSEHKCDKLPGRSLDAKYLSRLSGAQSVKELACFTMLHSLSHIKKELSGLSQSPSLLYQHWSHLGSALQT